MLFRSVFLLARRVPAPVATAQAQKEAADGSWIDRGVLLATGLNLCTSLVNPAIIAFTPLYARSLGVTSIEWFYIVSGVVSVLLQPLLGRMADTVGYALAIGLGLAAQLAGLVLIIASEGIGLLITGGLFAAIGIVLIGSMTTALAMEQADPRHRGRAMATYSMSWQFGAGAGALMAGGLADLTGFRGMYVGCGVITLIGLATLALKWRSLSPPAASGGSAR